jgi:hypothetical protein
MRVLRSQYNSAHGALSAIGLWFGLAHSLWALIWSHLKRLSSDALGLASLDGGSLWLVSDVNTADRRVNSKVRRHSHPIMYWTSIAFTTLLALACVAIGFGLLPGAHLK